MQRRLYKCSNPACGVTADEKKALDRGNGCKCGGKKPRTLRCPVCGAIMGRVTNSGSVDAKGKGIESQSL